VDSFGLAKEKTRISCCLAGARRIDQVEVMEATESSHLDWAFNFAKA